MYISERVRQLVMERANFQCEYCRVYQANAFYAFHIDHIISLKHGGDNSLDNFAFACSICNMLKGTDLGSILEPDGTIIRFFNPRKDIWTTHFEVNPNGILYPKTLEAEVTIKILQLNHMDTIIERRILIEIGLYP
ncbi:MAG: HNH endonuclease [Saprospiraceae bacterium]|nr:HNH endonuclease [Saprospiraceae bacterium]